jgi:hypothetical protein
VCSGVPRLNPNCSHRWSCAVHGVVELSGPKQPASKVVAATAIALVNRMGTFRLVFYRATITVKSRFPAASSLAARTSVGRSPGQCFRRIRSRRFGAASPPVAAALPLMFASALRALALISRQVSQPT